MTQVVWDDFDPADIDGAKRECGVCKRAREVRGGRGHVHTCECIRSKIDGITSDVARRIGWLGRPCGRAVCYNGTHQGMGDHEGQKVRDGGGEHAH